MLKLNAITSSNDGKRIVYDYQFNGIISKYLSEDDRFFVEYNYDVSEVPDSIKIIPFLANMLPIVWFSGDELEVDKVDHAFYEAMDAIKSGFKKLYPDTDLSKGRITYNELVTNTYETPLYGMLFSGGADAYATYFRHHEKPVDLITVWGADIALDDTEQWELLVSLNEEEKILKKNKKVYIKSNLRTFYTNDIQYIAPLSGWWNDVQYGMALNCVVAPISHLRGYGTLYIASSFTDDANISRGSAPEIDESIKWGNTGIIHDAGELKRQEKLGIIVNTAKQYEESDLKLRVCHSILNASIENSVNCSLCEKCYRTITNIILEDADPNDFGFEVTQHVYQNILKLFEGGFKTKQFAYFWGEISDKISKNEPFHVFSNREEERQELGKIRALVQKNLAKGIVPDSKLDKLKKAFRFHFPKLWAIYMDYRVKQVLKSKNTIR